MLGQSIRDGRIPVEYTTKKLSGWGGLAVFFEFARKIGFSDALNTILPDKKRSPNSISSVDLVNTFFSVVLTGGSRFSHVERLRDDEVLRTIIGADRVGGDDSIRRYFASLERSECEAVHESLQRVLGRLLSEQIKEDVLDLDSTIIERYGSQEGVSKGYHESRASQTSHYPLLGMLSKSRHIAHVWLRPGGASTLNGPAVFLTELLAQLPEGLKISLVRADSGFHAEDFIRVIEEARLNYIIAVRKRQPIERLIKRIAEGAWKEMDPEREVAEVFAKQDNWASERRLIIIRRVRRREVGLFETVDYDYSVLVTSLTAKPKECVLLYDARGECENTIKEFKSDFGARGFCLQTFYATELAVRLIAALFNLVSLFKRIVLNGTHVTLNTLRNKIFVLGAALGRRARTTILRLADQGRWTERSPELLNRVAALRPTAAQFTSPPISNAPSESYAV